MIKRNRTIFAAFCHLQKDSIVVNEGDHIQQACFLGRVGHSGNSTEPHLHFQMMDSDTIKTAKGLPFVFKHYQKYDGAAWQDVTCSIPAKGELVRFFD
ncbi:M23 family metallopeptidase [Enterococcus florum]|uniref:M23 family metallopeptidase n=1 Tax=Enterococcus florum TaxID=2480627 RepID=UPI00223E36F3|nr:peptidoglycan DD-metalloendopeptidase family protein [Enterococcus florum]